MTFILGAVFVMTATAYPVQDGDPEKAKKLIGRLDSDEAAEREAATKALLEMGESVRAPLEAARRNATPEAAGRISKVIELLDYGILASRAPWDFDAFAGELKAAYSQAGAARGKALRALGILLSDEEIATADKIKKPVHQKNPIFEYWVEVRPEQAARWSAALTKYVPTRKDDFLNVAARVAVQWAAKDKEAAQKWVEALQESDLRRRLVRELERR
jgi:hypothetical protein